MYFFVIRHKEKLQYTVVKENTLLENRSQNTLKVKIITFTSAASIKKYPKKLRRVVVWDEKNEQTIELITNQLTWTANTISELYKSRWQIEIFFREIKHNLHIKSFVGTTENAVMIQIWTALITILILKALKEIANHGWYLSNLVALVRLNLFVKVNLQDWLHKPFDEPPKIEPNITVQGILF